MKTQPGLMLLLLTGFIVVSQPSPECQCGNSVNTTLKYDSMPSEGGGTWPTLVNVATKNGRETFWVAYQYHRPTGEDMSRVVMSSDRGRTWQPAVGYRKTTANAYNASVIYKKSKEGLLSKSMDNGIHWSECLLKVDGATPHDFASKAAHNDHATLGFNLSATSPNDATTIYGAFTVAIPGDPGKLIFLPGVYVSHDAGDHFAMFAPNLRGTNPDERIQIGIDPSNPNRMIGHAQSGIVMTTDGGKSWFAVGQQAELEAPAQLELRTKALAARKDRASIPVHPDFTYLSVLEFKFHPGDSNVIYLVTNKGLYKTMDSTHTWCLLYVGKPSLYELNSLRVDDRHPNRLFLSTRNQILISEDGGCNFETVFDGNLFVH